MSAPWKYAGLYGPNTLLDQNSKEAANLSINVFLTGTTTFANLYTDQTKATGRSNPILSDAFGNFSFFADPGLYDLSYTLQGVPNKFTVSVAPYPGTSPFPNINARSFCQGGIALGGTGGWLGLPGSYSTAGASGGPFGYDAGGNMSSGATVYTAPITGIYQVVNSFGCSQDTADAGAFVQSAIGTKLASASSYTQQTGSPMTARSWSAPVALSVASILLNVGDSVQGWYQYSGSASTTSGPLVNYFEVTYLGPI